MEDKWTDYVRDNFKYDSQTGLVWWSKPGGRNRRGDRPAGSNDGQGYLVIVGQIEKERKKLRNHHIAWFLFYGEWAECYLDHINGDRADNRICNLRPATHKQNTQNAKVRVDSSTTFKGVNKIKGYNRWRARLSKGDSRVAIGSFGCPTVAALAYDKAAIEHYGDFARLNFPRG